MTCVISAHTHKKYNTKTDRASPKIVFFSLRLLLVSFFLLSTCCVNERVRAWTIGYCWKENKRSTKRWKKDASLFFCCCFCLEACSVNHSDKYLERERKKERKMQTYKRDRYSSCKKLAADVSGSGEKPVKVSCCFFIIDLGAIRIFLKTR